VTRGGDDGEIVQRIRKEREEERRGGDGEDIC
jgi:hypothetical protein